MTTAPATTVLDHIYRVAETSARRTMSDRQLLERFSRHQEQSAFTALVHRHGPMVYGVCQRILQHRADAEDAFQATFLVLARKVDSIHWQDSIANWLYGVAYRLALKMRSARARRKECTSSTAIALETAQGDNEQPNAVLPLLDEELKKLPDKYRAPLVLFYLEGKSREDVARQLGWTMHSVKGRLERGRDLLRQRLTKRGVVLSVGTLFAALHQSTAGAEMPATLVRTTVAASCQAISGCSLAGAISPSVGFLFQEATKIMFSTKLKLIALAGVLATALGIGVGLQAQQTMAENPQSQQPNAANKLVLVRGEARFEDEGDGERERRGISGWIKSLDLKKGTITLTIQRDGEEKRNVTYSLAGKDIKVLANRETASRLSDLNPGLRVTVFLSETEDVTAIRVQAPRRRLVRGTVAAISPTKNTLSLKIRGEGRDIVRTYKVARNCRFMVPKKEDAQLTDVKVGEKIIVALGEGKRITEARTGNFRGDRERGEGRRLTAQLISVNEKKPSITILVRRDAGDEKKTLTLAKKVRIVLGEERPAKLGDLEKGKLYLFRLSEDGEAVTDIRPFRRGGRRRPQIRGAVKSVDVKQKTITLSVPREGGDKRDATFAVSPEARINLGRDRAGQLSDLKAGMRVTIQLTPNRETAVGIVILNRERDREKD